MGEIPGKPSGKTLQLAGFLVLGLLNTVIFTLLTAYAPVWEKYSVPFLEQAFLVSGGIQVQARFVLAIYLSGLAYLAALKLARGLSGRLAWTGLLLGSGGPVLALIFLAPASSNDIFDYIIQGRILGVYQQNPYLAIPADFPGDPFLPYTGWPKHPFTYGPLWGYLSAITATLAGNGLVQNLLAFKLLPGIFHLGSLGLVALILRRQSPARMLSGTLLLAWNPVVLYETWGMGHNGMVMVFWLLAAVLALTYRRFRIAMICLVLGALVKFIPLMLVPAALLVAWKALPARKDRLAYLVTTGLASLGLVVLAYGPLWAGPTTLTVLERDTLFTTSLPAILYWSLNPAGGESTTGMLVGRACALLTLLFALWAAWKHIRSPAQPGEQFENASFVTLAFYLLGTILWFWPWYTQWLIALAALQRDWRKRFLAILFGFTAMGKAFIFGPHFAFSDPPLPQPQPEIIVTLGVMALPWLWILRSALSRRAGTGQQGSAGDR